MAPAEIVAGVQRGDPAAEEALAVEVWRWEKHARRILRTTGEDSAQETLVMVWRAIASGTLRDPAKLRSYIWAVMRSRIITEIRKRRGKDQDVAITDDIFCAPTPDPEVRLIMWERTATAERAIRSLPKARDREIMRRYYIEGEHAAEIRRDLGLSETQYRQCKTRAKRRVVAFAQVKTVRPATS